MPTQQPMCSSSTITCSIIAVAKNGRVLLVRWYYFQFIRTSSSNKKIINQHHHFIIIWFTAFSSLFNHSSERAYIKHLSAAVCCGIDISYSMFTISPLSNVFMFNVYFDYHFVFLFVLRTDDVRYGTTTDRTVCTCFRPPVFWL